MKRRRRSLGSSSITHEHKAQGFQNTLRLAAQRAEKNAVVGDCRKAFHDIEDVRIAEGVIRAHYSATDEVRRGSGTDLNKSLMSAVDVAYRASATFRKHCVRGGEK